MTQIENKQSNIEEMTSTPRRSLPLIAENGRAALGHGGAQAQRPARSLRIALVNMPWARVVAPSIQCGILKAELESAGHRVDVHYLNLELASELGAAVYGAFAGLNGERIHLLGEWMFTSAAFGCQQDHETYFNAFPEIETQVTGFGLSLDALCHLKDKILPEWIENMAASVPWHVYDLVGFTSTFEQNVAALALGAAVKRHASSVPLVFGGGNFEGEMGREYLRVFPWIDYVVSGEGDLALPALAATLAQGLEASLKSGVVRRAPEAVCLDGPRVKDMNLVPTPDYRDYFAALERLGRTSVLGRQDVIIPVEFSRGCWWGEKHHCTFCGLNASSMTFRSKAPEHAMSCIETLVERHNIVQFEAVDNILDMTYLNDLCTRIIDSGINLGMFFEVKANLTRKQLANLSRAGIGHIQPGIESMSTHILELMRKGTTMPLNVRLLKWANYYNITITWNILMGFPGEEDEDYRKQIELIPSLHHLPPPAVAGRLWLERYSPYYSDDSFPIHDTAPKEAYRYAYPVDEIDYRKIAYFFDYKADVTASDEMHQKLREAIREWTLKWQTRRAQLLYELHPGHLEVRDTRQGVAEYILSDWRSEVFLACEEAPRSPGRIAEELASGGMHITKSAITDFLEECVSDRLAVVESGKYLTVALPSRACKDPDARQAPPS